MPAVPRLPFVPDLLNRVKIPGDLDSVTTVGDEVPDGGSIGTEGVEKIWKAAVAMYRSGVHPAVQVCVRREGEIVLDRAIGHARGNGPDDSKDTPKVAATPDTPMTVYSAAKGVTAFVAHKLVEKGLFALDDPVAKYIPGYDKNKKGSITIGHVLSHRAGVPNLPARGAEPRVRQRPRVPGQGALRREADRRSRASNSPTTRSRAGSSSARSSIKSPASRSATSLPRSSSTRSASAGPTTASRRRTPRRSPSTT